jgi:folate-binding protein YgfZ
MFDWNDFLASSTNPASVAKGLNTIEEALENTCLMLLPQGIISVTGPDAAKFLQGQVTCDVRELSDNKSLLGAQCNIKGRMLLCFRALQSTNEQILLRVHQGLVTHGLASLGKYIVFSKAKLADVTTDYYCLGLAGPKAALVIKNVFNVDIAENGDWQAVDNHKIIRIDDQRYECWLTTIEAEKIWNQLKEQTICTYPEVWTLLNIRAGLGEITPETYETFTPQAINFQLVDGINFRKGCYTGQEIVARLHYRGTLKRHMYRFEFALNGYLLPLPGSPLVNEAGKSVGEIILAAPKSASAGELLASVVDDELVAIYLANNPQKLSLLSLPYAIPTSNEAD